MIRERREATVMLGTISENREYPTSFILAVADNQGMQMRLGMPSGDRDIQSLSFLAVCAGSGSGLKMRCESFRFGEKPALYTGSRRNRGGVVGIPSADGREHREMYTECYGIANSVYNLVLRSYRYTQYS